LELSVDREVFESAFYAASDGIVITDADFSEGGPHILYANPGFTKITGYELHEVVGKNPSFLQGRKTDRRVLEKLKDDLLRGDHFFGQTWNYKKDGTPFLMQWSIADVKNSQGTVKYYVAIQRDATEREAIIE
jgi:PAS domain S-box-containing protein